MGGAREVKRNGQLGQRKKQCEKRKPQAKVGITKRP